MQSKTLCANLMVFALTLMLMSQPAQAISGAAVDIVLNNQNPYPVHPGQNLDVDVSVQNTGYDKANEVVVEILPKEPFTLLPGQETRKVFTGILGLASRSVTYRLATDMEAFTGSYDLEFRVYVDSSQEFSIEKVQINVQGEPDLVVESMETIPENIEPGSQIKIKATIKNVGTGTAHDLSLALSSAYEEIVPLLAGGTVYLGDLEPEQSKVAELLVSIDSSAEEKTYTLTLTGSYKDETNTASSKAFSIGLPVKGNINMEIINQEANYVRNVVKIEIANKGTADANSLESKLVVDGKTVGIYYVSQLKATKKTTLEFPLVMQGSGTLVMTYTGPGIEKNTVEKEIIFDFTPPSNNDGFTFMIYIVIVAVVVYILYRKFLRKKKTRK